MTNKLWTFERAQHGGAPSENSSCQGEAGEGVYAYVPDAGMRSYYTSTGERTYPLHQIDGDTVNFEGVHMVSLLAFARAELTGLAARIPGYQVPSVSSANIQRFGRVIEQYVNRNHPNAVAYVVPHGGPGIPTGRQAVIRKMSSFRCEAL